MRAQGRARGVGTSPQGAVVTYTAPTARDESGDTPATTVSCDPTSCATFAFGTTTVICTATESDDRNSPVSASFTVTVQDVTAPTLNLPSTIQVDATSSQGATGSYTIYKEDSRLMCSCAAGKYRRYCKHRAIVREDSHSAVSGTVK